MILVTPRGQHQDHLSRSLHCSKSKLFCDILVSLTSFNQRSLFVCVWCESTLSPALHATPVCTPGTGATLVKHKS